MEFFKAWSNWRSQTIGQRKLFDSVHPQSVLPPIWQDGGHTAVIEADGGDVVANEITTRLAKRRRQGGFPGAGDAAQGHPPAPIRKGGGVQNKLSALMKQDAEGGAQQEGRGVGGGRRRVEINDNLVSIRDEETRDLWNPKQKSGVVKLPRRPDPNCGVQRCWRRAAPNAHIRLRQDLVCDHHPWKRKIGCDGKTADSIVKQRSSLRLTTPTQIRRQTCVTTGRKKDPFHSFGWFLLQ
ncbi:hypothetical protein [Azospirillum cavernae]|uniref:hypothetical protein n=1 Tax=Azospirillum cavernae TaxID=2320860 RepID=UPI0011C381D0|nr:hypothetical protein [Azospirillum cavernae]